MLLSVCLLSVLYVSIQDDPVCDEYAGCDEGEMMKCRYIRGGDLSAHNMWLCEEMCTLLLSRFDWLISDRQHDTPSFVLYAYLRYVSRGRSTSGRLGDRLSEADVLKLGS